jgi:hypothetical protein
MSNKYLVRPSKLHCEVSYSPKSTFLLMPISSYFVKYHPKRLHSGATPRQPNGGYDPTCTYRKLPIQPLTTRIQSTALSSVERGPPVRDHFQLRSAARGAKVTWMLLQREAKNEEERYRLPASCHWCSPSNCVQPACQLRAPSLRRRY